MIWRPIIGLSRSPMPGIALFDLSLAESIHHVVTVGLKTMVDGRVLGARS